MRIILQTWKINVKQKEFAGNLYRQDFCVSVNAKTVPCKFRKVCSFQKHTTDRIHGYKYPQTLNHIFWLQSSFNIITRKTWRPLRALQSRSLVDIQSVEMVDTSGWFGDRCCSFWDACVAYRVACFFERGFYASERKHASDYWRKHVEIKCGSRCYNEDKANTFDTSCYR